MNKEQFLEKINFSRYLKYIISQIKGSKEDEEKVNDLIAYFTADMSLKHTEEDIVNWLKSFKERMQSQNK